MQSYPARALDRRLQVDWARDPREGPRVLMSLRVDFEPMVMQAPLELVGLGSSSSMDSFASWKMNGSRIEKEEREETPLQGEDESRRSSPP